MIFTFSDFIKNGEKSIWLTVLQNAGELGDLRKQQKSC